MPLDSIIQLLAKRCLGSKMIMGTEHFFFGAIYIMTAYLMKRVQVVDSTQFLYVTLSAWRGLYLVDKLISLPPETSLTSSEPYKVPLSATVRPEGREALVGG